MFVFLVPHPRNSPLPIKQNVLLNVRYHRAPPNKLPFRTSHHHRGRSLVVLMYGWRGGDRAIGGVPKSCWQAGSGGPSERRSHVEAPAAETSLSSECQVEQWDFCPEGVQDICWCQPQLPTSHSPVIDAPLSVPQEWGVVWVFQTCRSPHSPSDEIKNVKLQGSGGGQEFKPRATWRGKAPFIGSVQLKRDKTR